MLNPGPHGIPRAAPLLRLAQATRPAAAPGAPVQADWTAFKRRYLAPDGRVVDTGNAGISHSEGQSYGMLFAVFFDDREAFDQIWTWTSRTLRRPGDALSAWKYVPRGPVFVPDSNNATDGDVILAWALLRAAMKWGEGRYADAASAIAHDVLRLCVADFVDRRILLPGARGFVRGDRIVVNPSYFAIAAFRALSRLVPSTDWAAMEAASLDILHASALGRWQLPPDWCEILRDGVIQPAADWPPRFSWDAIRIPVHLAWAGLPEAAVQSAATFFFDQSHAYRPPAWTDLYRNTISPYPGHAGVLSVAQFAALRSRLNVQTRRIAISEAPDYYGASLVLMTGIAQAEPPEPPAEVPVATPAARPAQSTIARVMQYFGRRDDAAAATPPTVAPASPENPLARRGGRDGGR
jgi:endoglucanase